MNLCFVVKAPSNCTRDEIKDFTTLAIKGGEVIRNGLEERIDRAHLLGFCYDGETLIGIAALKKPNEGYRDDVFAKAASPCNAESFDKEIGWAFTDDRYRGQGVCSTLLHDLMKDFAHRNVFATSRSTNKGIHRILGRLGFVQSGNAYPGRNEEIYLFVNKGDRVKSLLLTN